MQLNRHIARRVKGIVIVEADGEEAVEIPQTARAHQLFAVGSNHGIEGKLHAIAVHVQHRADLHRNHVKDPRAVLHGVGEVPLFHGQVPAPDPLKVNGALAQGIVQCAVNQRGQDRPGHHLECVGRIGADVPVQLFARKQTATQGERQFKIDIVATPHGRLERECFVRAVVAVGAFFDVQHRLLRRNVRENVKVGKVVEFLAQRTVSVKDHRPALFRQSFLQCRQLFSVKQPGVARLEQPTVQQDGVFFAVLGEVVRKQGFEFGGGLVNARNRNQLAVGGEQTNQRVKRRGGVAVDGNDPVFLAEVGKNRRQLCRTARNPVGLHTAVIGQVVDRVRVVVGEGIEHKTHGCYLFSELTCLMNARMKSGRSSGRREVMRLPSTTTGLFS